MPLSNAKLRAEALAVDEGREYVKRWREVSAGWRTLRSTDPVGTWVDIELSSACVLRTCTSTRALPMGKSANAWVLLDGYSVDAVRADRCRVVPDPT